MSLDKPSKKPVVAQAIQKMNVVDEDIEEALFSKKKIKEIKLENKKKKDEEAAKELLKEYNLDEVINFESDPLIDSFDIIDED